MMVRVLFHREALPPPTRRRGRPFVLPIRWQEAQHRVLLLEGWDPRGEGHGCALDALGHIYYTVGDHPTAVEHRWEEVVRPVQARLPYVTAGAFVALPPVSAQLATRGDPQSPPTLAGHAARTRFCATVGPRLDGGSGTAVRSE